MDAGAWIGAVALLAAALGVVALAPGMLRRHRARQAAGRGGALSGVAGGLDAVWRPSAEDAHAQWESQIKVPAPAPAPGDRGLLDDGPLVIRVEKDSPRG